MRRAPAAAEMRAARAPRLQRPAGLAPRAPQRARRGASAAAQLSSQQRAVERAEMSAEERLHMQMRGMPPAAAAEALALAALENKLRPLEQGDAQQLPAAPARQRQQQHQQAQQQQAQQQAQQQQAQQQRQPLAVLRQLLSKLPKLDGRLQGLVLLNIMTLLMGSNWVVVKASAEGASMTDAPTFMAMRFMLAAVLFVPFLKPQDKAITKAGIEMGAWYALGYIAQAIALSHTAASRASLLSTFTVLTVPMIAGLSGQHIKPIVWACAAAALAGTAMLEEGSSLGPPNVGDAWAVASALFFGAQMFLAERAMHKLPKGSELPLMSVSMLTVAALAAAAAVGLHAGDLPAAASGLRQLLGDWQAMLPGFLGGGAPVPTAEAEEAARTLQQLLYTAVVSTDLVLFVELVALQNMSSTDAAMIYSLEPVAGALMAYAFLGERWGLWGWVGGAVILGSSMLTQVQGTTDDGDDGGEGQAAGAAPPAPAAVAAAAASRDQ